MTWYWMVYIYTPPSQEPQPCHLEVVRHVGVQHARDDDAPHLAVYVVVQEGEYVSLGRGVGEGVETRDVAVLQHAAVVVRHSQGVLGVHRCVAPLSLAQAAQTQGSS